MLGLGPARRRIAEGLRSLAGNATADATASAIDLVEDVSGHLSSDVLEPAVVARLHAAFAQAGAFKERDVLVLPGRSKDIYVDWARYRDATVRAGDFVAELWRRGFEPVYVLRRSEKGGGGLAGAWYCKSHLFAFLYFYHVGALRDPRQKGDHQPPPRLLLLGENAGGGCEGRRALASLSSGTSARHCVVHVLDGVYSGLEAQATAKFLASCLNPGPDLLLAVVTPVASVPNAFGGVVLGGDAEEGAKTADLEAFGRPILFGGLTVARHRGFVLPFKIADEASLGELSDQLELANPGFRPPYRRLPACDPSNPVQAKEARAVKTGVLGRSRSDDWLRTMHGSARLVAFPTVLSATTATHWRPLPASASWGVVARKLQGDLERFNTLLASDAETADVRMALGSSPFELARLGRGEAARLEGDELLLPRAVYPLTHARQKGILKTGCSHPQELAFRFLVRQDSGCCAATLEEGQVSDVCRRSSPVSQVGKPLALYVVRVGERGVSLAAFEFRSSREVAFRT